MSTEHLDWMTHESELNMSVEQIGEVVYTIALWIDNQGNRGYRMHVLKANHLPTAVLDLKYKQAWQDIVFEAEASRKSDYDGWGVHKINPRHWTHTWMDRYGVDSPIGQRLYGEAWEAAHVINESRRVRRTMDTVAGYTLEELRTIDVAYYMAAFAVLCGRARRRYFDGDLPNPFMDLQIKLYALTSQAFRDELHYRTKTQPQKRRSKKATLAAWADWEKAAGFLEAGAHHFFTQAFMDQCVVSVTDLDLSVDYENLPRGTISETPIMRLPDRDLVREFMAMLTGEDEFEREDAEAILRALRPMVARAKGQGATIAAVQLPSGDEAEV